MRGHFFGQSSFATHALATERNVVKVRRALPLELLAPLGCGLQTGAGTVMNSLAVRRGRRIAVFGTGSVGLAAVMAARIVGADPIIAVDVNRSVSPLAVGSVPRTPSTTPGPTSPRKSAPLPAAASITSSKIPAMQSSTAPAWIS